MTPDPKTEALKPLPCPFCGETPAVRTGDGVITIVRCINKDCSVRSESDDDSAEVAIAAWNTRADTPDRINQDYAQKRIAELEAGAAAMRDALCQILRNNCTIITEEIASEALNSTTAGTDFAERFRKAEEGLGIAWADKDAAMIERDELKQQLAAVTAERDALAKAIQDAPHGPKCPMGAFQDRLSPCDCWKASAMKGAE